MTNLLAIITTQPKRVAGGVPIFIVTDHDELQRKSFTLEKILDGMVHELDPDTLIVVRHS